MVDSLHGVWGRLRDVGRHAGTSDIIEATVSWRCAVVLDTADAIARTRSCPLHLRHCAVKLLCAVYECASERITSSRQGVSSVSQGSAPRSLCNEHCSDGVSRVH